MKGKGLSLSRGPAHSNGLAVARWGRFGGKMRRRLQLVLQLLASSFFFFLSSSCLSFFLRRHPRRQRKKRERQKMKKAFLAFFILLFLLCCLVSRSGPPSVRCLLFGKNWRKRRSRFIGRAITAMAAITGIMDTMATITPLTTFLRPSLCVRGDMTLTTPLTVTEDATAVVMVVAMKRRRGGRISNFIADQTGKLRCDGVFSKFFNSSFARAVSAFMV